MDAQGAEERAIAALGREADWADGATALLRDLGFSLIHSDRPWAPEGSHLIVALRDTPTLRHFDPEAVEQLTRFATRVTPWLERSAVVGLTGVKRDSVIAGFRAVGSGPDLLVLDRN